MSTPFEQAGFTADDVFVLKAGEYHHRIKEGEQFKLAYDDNTSTPFFTNDRIKATYSNKRTCCRLHRIERVEQKPEGKTLLQILTEELPKRGGWPKGADY